MAVTPAGAQVNEAIATNWKKIWKKELKPLARKTFYTKKQSKQRFQPKGSYETAGSGYTKAESDAKYAGAGSGYTKAESDARYAPYPRLIKGTYFMTGTPAVAGGQVGSDITFGYTLPEAPTVHYIPTGALPPDGCSGTVEEPNALPGHLCVFERLDNNASDQAIYNATGTPGLSSRMGALLNATSTAAGDVFVYGSWAVRPTAVSGTAAGSGRGASTGDPTLGR